MVASSQKKPAGQGKQVASVVAPVFVE